MPDREQKLIGDPAKPALWGEDCQTSFVPEPQRDRGTALAVDEVFPWLPHGHPERSPAEIPPSRRLVLLRSSTPLRFAQYDTTGRSRTRRGSDGSAASGR